MSTSKNETQVENRWEPQALQSFLSENSGRNVVLMVTNNTSSIISFKHDGGKVVLLRAHRMFLDAPAEVASALAKWIGGRKNRRDIVQEFIDENRGDICRGEYQARRQIVREEGTHHHLGEIRDYLNSTYLQNRSTAPVTWGRSNGKRKSRSIRLGFYDPVRNLISINRRLDKTDIPRYMVEYVIFHEMLHEVLGIGRRADGKRDIHGKTFRLLEHTYPFYEKALAFEKMKWG